jgi:hypothetical protein
MTDTFRALCAELMDAIDSGIPRGRIKQSPLAVRVDAALARPEPQGPTDEELDELFTDIDQGGEALSWRPYARAILARWGRPAIEPVPVSERLPGPEDCDAEGRCYGWDGDYWWMVGNPGITITKYTGYTHWLPHWALPVPGVEGADA